MSTATMTCERHEHCAYTGTEPDRCPACHSTWAVIEACSCPDCGSREHHQAVHQARDAQRAKKIARLAEARKARRAVRL